MSPALRWLAAFAVAIVLAGCTPIPEDFGRTSPPASGGPGTSAPSGSPGVTVDGTTVRIIGRGESKSEMFELPAGDATMVITACQSNRVMPFITLLHESEASGRLIVDPEKVLRNLAAGMYYISAQANPDCVWQVEITPN